MAETLSGIHGHHQMAGQQLNGGGECSDSESLTFLKLADIG
jgi:hypothetical protein